MSGEPRDEGPPEVWYEAASVAAGDYVRGQGLGAEIGAICDKVVQACWRVALPPPGSPPPSGDGPTTNDAGLESARSHFVLHYVPHLQYQQPDGSWKSELRRDMMRDLGTMLAAALSGGASEDDLREPITHEQFVAWGRAALSGGSAPHYPMACPHCAETIPAEALADYCRGAQPASQPPTTKTIDLTRVLVDSLQKRAAAPPSEPGPTVADVVSVHAAGAPLWGELREAARRALEAWDHPMPGLGPSGLTLAIGALRDAVARLHGRQPSTDT